MCANLYIFFYYFKYCDDYFSIDDKIIKFFLSSSFGGDKKNYSPSLISKNGCIQDRLLWATKIHYINNKPPKDLFFI